jgi:hypothetical protein
MNAAGGAVICLNSGTYSDPSLSSVTKASDVTIQPASGATVTISGVTINASTHLRFTGVGSTDGSSSTMSVHGFEIDNSSGCSSNVTFDHITFTSSGSFLPKFSCSHGLNILFDHDRFDNLPNDTWEARFNIQAMDTGPSSPTGLTISNSHFGGFGLSSPSNCSDGIDLLGGAYGSVIGPGNEFTGISQGTCSAHVDPIQFYGDSHNTIIGNYFHDNGDGSGGIMAPDGSDPSDVITNNVFVCSCDYPASIVAAGATNMTISHNTFAGSGQLSMGNSNKGAAPTGNLVQNNAWINGGGMNVVNGYGSNDHNLNSGQSGTANITGTPVLVSSPSSGYYHYQIASSSPGYNAASDGKSMGIAP